MYPMLVYSLFPFPFLLPKYHIKDRYFQSCSCCPSNIKEINKSLLNTISLQFVEAYLISILIFVQYCLNNNVEAK